MSLLDGEYSPDPLSMGLLGLGSALMTPRAMGGGVGPGMQAFAQQAMAAQMQRQQMRRMQQQDELQRKLLDLRLTEATESAEDRKRAREAQARLAKAATDAYTPASPGSLGGGVAPGSQQGQMLLNQMSGDPEFDAAMLGSTNAALNSVGPRQAVSAPTAGGFDSRRFLDNLRAAGMPLEAAKYEKEMRGENPFGKIDPKDFTPESLAAFIQNGGRDPSVLRPYRSVQVVDGVAYDPRATEPGTLLRNPDRIAEQNIIPDGNGGYRVNPLAVQAKKEIAAAGAPRISTPTYVNTEGTYAGEVARGFAKQDVDTINIARGATASIEAAQRVKSLLAQNPITGTGAQFATQVGKALATAGLIDGQRVKSTEDLASELASATLGEIAASGLGSGQGFTDKDRAFLQDARSGRIELNAGTIYRLADLRERSARAAIRRGNEVGERLRADKNMGSVGRSINFTEPPRSALPLPQNLTPQNLIIGAEYDLGSRGRARWNGMAFDPIKD